jgi:hypothetical protein
MSWMSTTVLHALRDERGGSGPPKAWEPLAKDLLREFQEQQQGRRQPSDAAGGPPQQDAQRWKTVMKACRGPSAILLSNPCLCHRPFFHRRRLIVTNLIFVKFRYYMYTVRSA